MPMGSLLWCELALRRLSAPPRLWVGARAGALAGAGGSLSLSLSVTVLKPRPGVKRPALTVRGPRRAYWAWRAGGARDLAFI